MGEVFETRILLLRIRMPERTEVAGVKPYPERGRLVVSSLPLGAFRRHISALPLRWNIDFVLALVSRGSAVFQYFHQLSSLSIHFFFFYYGIA